MPKGLGFNKIEEFFKELPRALAEHAFLGFLVLFIIIFIASAFIFYEYSILAQKVEPQITEKALQFKENNYQEILKIWQNRDKNFREAGSNNFPNPFQGISAKTEPTVSPTVAPE